ncbi:MAG: ZIP family metal transporter [Sphaerimonospora mesophila]
MSTMTQVIFFSLIGGIFSLIGATLLLMRKSWAQHLITYATPFAAGALLAAAFIDLLGEAAHEGNAEVALQATLAGILVFFLLERAIHWFHHHSYDRDHKNEVKSAKVPLIIIGDTLHNFIDGIAIAAAFLVSPATGIVVTLAVALHEIPQEIGDFGLLLSKGLGRRKVLLVNVVSALATTVAAVLFFALGQNVAVPLDIVLGLTAGFFIYIAVSDIIPEIHAHEQQRFIGWQSVLLIVGVILVSVITAMLHGFIEA